MKFWKKRKKTMTVNLDWENLGFSYMKLPYRYLAYYRNWPVGKRNINRGRYAPYL